MSAREILDELSLAQGFAMIAWSIEHNTVCDVVRVGRGYIGLEIDERLAALKAARKTE
jgi:hypothetical protein